MSNRRQTALLFGAIVTGVIRKEQKMSNISQQMQDSASEIASLLEKLLLEHSSLYDWNSRSRGMQIISVEGNYSYEDLETESRQLQSRIMELYKKQHSLLFTILANEPEETVRKLDQIDGSITRIIEQRQTWSSTVAEENKKAAGFLYAQVELLDRLHSTSSEYSIIVPDTNALIHNPAFEEWNFDKTDKIEIVLLATVLSELDALKINHRNERVREKAEKIIRQIKEYRRRGALTAGVSIVKGRVKLRTIALEPTMADSLPWFDPSNNDDRFLAATIEVIRKHLRSQVTLVTRDINLQNKAEFSNVPFTEPPNA